MSRRVNQDIDASDLLASHHEYTKHRQHQLHRDGRHFEREHILSVEQVAMKEQLPPNRWRRRRRAV